MEISPIVLLSAMVLLSDEIFYLNSFILEQLNAMVGGTFGTWAFSIYLLDSVHLLILPPSLCNCRHHQYYIKISEFSLLIWDI